MLVILIPGFDLIELVGENNKRNGKHKSVNCYQNQNYKQITKCSKGSTFELKHKLGTADPFHMHQVT